MAGFFFNQKKQSASNSNSNDDAGPEMSFRSPNFRSLSEHLDSQPPGSNFKKDFMMQS